MKKLLTPFAIISSFMSVPTSDLRVHTNFHLSKAIHQGLISKEQTFVTNSQVYSQCTLVFTILHECVSFVSL